MLLFSLLLHNTVYSCVPGNHVTNLAQKYLKFENKTLRNLTLEYNGSPSYLLRSRLCHIYGQPGWKCDEKTCRKKDHCCLPFDWVCDGHYQCIEDDSDEEIGCLLF